MDCLIKISWRGNIVLSGKATQVMAYDTVRGFFAGNFAGLDFQQWLASEFPAFGHCAASLKRKGWRQWQWSDETGTGFADITIV